MTTPPARSIDWHLVLDGIDFGEGPRWHDGRLWFSDFFQHTISSVAVDGNDAGQRRIEVRFPADRPSGLGWLPDGRLVFTAMRSRRLMRVEPDGAIVEHADLSAIATGDCNDIVVAADGTAYAGNFGFDFAGGGDLRPATLAIVRPDGSALAGPGDLLFPNGSVITPDGATLIVGESFGGRYTAFAIAADGTLGERRTWAEVPGAAPDGCTLDADGAIWFSDAIGDRVVRVHEGGTVSDALATPDHTYACMLGGADGRTLFVITGAGSDEATAAGTGTGCLWSTHVDVGRAEHSLP